MSRIVITDEIDVRGPDAVEIQSRYLKEYAPTAEARGATLQHQLMHPPIVLAEGRNRLTFVWTVEDLPGWWKLRLQGASNKDALDFWQAIEPQVLSRSRRSHATEVQADV